MTASLQSPTLLASATAQGDNTYALTLSRPIDAYSRYGADANSRQVGTALDRAAGNAAAGLHPLVAALDFSTSDGTVVTSALRQLSPSVYASEKGRRVNDSFYARSAVYNRLEQAFGGAPSSATTVMGCGPGRGQAAILPLPSVTAAWLPLTCHPMTCSVMRRGVLPLAAGRPNQVTATLQAPNPALAAS
ncbi:MULTISPECIES: hypothetical protein [unclassified Bradyrhizobium]|uniref:hypothetical protein n=1 Tax=unclassified Bradyrhizobium TaxID=2631580 RepID=UPI0024787111|nr:MULTISPECIES: hypothetical protein [unclassified Bradyrhizobium]WGS19289.1 hypothetical protein MTX22_33490 [Bradyrhizobium sp. ISRA463]WGS31546.1 hypothetical protein MTX19_30995 [Bradyrhizobium sp. ISRA464]